MYTHALWTYLQIFNFATFKLDFTFLEVQLLRELSYIFIPWWLLWVYKWISKINIRPHASSSIVNKHAGLLIMSVNVVIYQEVNKLCLLPCYLNLPASNWLLAVDSCYSWFLNKKNHLLWKILALWWFSVLFSDPWWGYQAMYALNGHDTCNVTHGLHHPIRARDMIWKCASTHVQKPEVTVHGVWPLLCSRCLCLHPAWQNTARLYLKDFQQTSDTRLVIYDRMYRQFFDDLEFQHESVMSPGLPNSACIKLVLAAELGSWAGEMKTIKMHGFLLILFSNCWWVLQLLIYLYSYIIDSIYFSSSSVWRVENFLKNCHVVWTMGAY